MRKWSVAGDVGVTLARLVSVAAHLSYDRGAFGRGSLPMTVDDLTPTWLNRVLEATGLPVVTAVRSLDDNAGTTHRVRLGLAYDHDPGLDAPQSVFCKLPPSDVRTRMFVTLMGLGEHEVAFYRHVRPSVPVLTPTPYVALVDRRRARFCLVTEDLTARACRFDDVRSPCSPERAEAVLVALGRLHGAFWASDRFAGDLRWMRSTSADPSAAVGRLLVTQARKTALVRFSEIIPEDIGRRTAVLVERRIELEAAWAKGAPTLLHGDPHIGNLYFDGDEVGFLDWQVIRRGPALRDVAYFLVLSLATEVRRACERDLLRAYITSLRQSGGPALPFAEVWTQYRHLAPYPWIAAVVTATAGTLQAAEIARTGLVRSTAALEDLEAFAAVDTLLANGT